MLWKISRHKAQHLVSSTPFVWMFLFVKLSILVDIFFHVYDKNPTQTAVSQKGNVMTQVSSGWLPSGMAGFRCLNNVIAFDPSFCLSLGSVLFAVGATLRQASFPGDLWQLQAYSFLSPKSNQKRELLSFNISDKTPRIESHWLWLSHCGWEANNSDWVTHLYLADLNWEEKYYYKRENWMLDRGTNNEKLLLCWKGCRWVAEG